MASPSVLSSSLPSSLPPSEHSPNKHWGIQFGGLIALKYLVPLHLETFMKNYESELFYVLKECLRNANDDISGSAADLVKSLFLGIKKECQFIDKNNVCRALYLSNLIGVESTYLSCIVEDVTHSVLSLDALSCRMLSLCVGFSSICAILEIMSTQHERDLLHFKLNRNAAVKNDYYKNENKTEIDKENENDVLNQNPYTEKVLGITVSLSNALSLLLFRLMLYSRDSQDRYLTALKPGAI